MLFMKLCGTLSLICCFFQEKNKKNDILLNNYLYIYRL